MGTSSTIFLLLSGLTLLLVALTLAQPRVFQRLTHVIAGKSLYIVLIGCFMVLLSLPVLVHYFSLLYPLDMLVLPAASATFFLGLVCLLFPTESAVFIGKLVEKKNDLFLRMMALILALVGLVLLNVALQ